MNSRLLKFLFAEELCELSIAKLSQFHLIAQQKADRRLIDRFEKMKRDL